MAPKDDAYLDYALHGAGLDSIDGALVALDMPSDRRSLALRIVNEVCEVNESENLRWYITPGTPEISFYWGDLDRNVLWVTNSEVHVLANEEFVELPDRGTNWSKQDGKYVGWRLSNDETESLDASRDGMTMDQELELRRRWYHAHADLWEAERNDASADKEAEFGASAAEAMQIFGDLERTGDLQEFKSKLQEWSVKPTTLAFNGFNGQMFINQLVNAEGDPAVLSRLLVDGARLPQSDAEAEEKLSALVEFTDEVRTGAHPSPGRVIFVLPYMWAIQAPEIWPVLWSSSQRYLDVFEGPVLPAEHVSRYMTFRDRARALDENAWRFSEVTRWWDDHSPVFINEVVCERCELGEAVNDLANAHALVGVGRYVSAALSEDVAGALGRSVHAKKPGVMWSKDWARGDSYADWWITEKGGLGIRVWVNSLGMAIGVRVGYMGDDWYARAAEVIDNHPVAGYELLAGGNSTTGADAGFSGGMAGEYVYARWVPKADLGELDLRAAVVRAATELQPLLDHLDAAAKGGEPDDFATENDPLTDLVAEFHAVTDYPESADEQHRSDREQFAKILQAETLPTIDLGELRRIYNSGRYESPGPQSILNVTVRDADAAGYDRIIDTIGYLLWGDGEDAARIDELLAGEKKIPGLAESVMMKLLAIAHPDKYVPIFPYSGAMGKRRMLGVLDLPEPSGTRGALQVESSRAIHKRLNRFFPGDPWGMNRFCYWLSQRSEEPEIDDLESRLDDLAENELIPREFLSEIVQLLQEKGQVIFYGPPGTGKTYLARKLAEALAPDPARRKLVQFHPSTSYEDFFEGFRPEAGVEGDISYRLTSGPLALMAEDAQKAPGARHVMVIDEINRGNLPKVFGELLFLLEYRGEAVTTLYRPDDPFELPKDMFFIGTMNTADQSIALVDAALRRRFHFFPFFPDVGHMSGLLERWLEKNEEPAWVHELVSMVNAELTEKLGGRHLLIGPSYFMSRGLTKEKVELVWKYNIQPFIEDQFFGDAEQIKFFGFDRVWARHQKQVGGAQAAVNPAESESTEADDV